MGHPGLEPGTNRLKAEYSTIELVTREARFAHRLLNYHKRSKVLQLISMIIVIAN
jgi:hypothetical protein